MSGSFSEPGERDEDYRVAVDFWWREFSRRPTTTGPPVNEHLKAGRAVLVEMVLPE